MTAKRRILAIVMTIMLLLGMLPGASAYACDHPTTKTQWVNGAPANCMDWKVRIEMCTVCGAVVYEWEESGSCAPEWVVLQAPTCYSDGYRQKICRYCGEPHDEEIIPGGHSFGSWRQASEGNCAVPALYQRVCSQCGEIEERRGDYGAHNWGPWRYDMEPTCTEAGVRSRECTVCGRGDEEEVPPTGHNFGEWEPVSAATCIEPGVRMTVCRNCGYIVYEDTDYGPHRWGDWVRIREGDCLNPGVLQRTCSLCGRVEQREDEEGSHKWGVRMITDPTCTKEGLDSYRCTVCGKTRSKTIDALGHNWSDWEVIQEAKPGQVGIRERRCRRCGITEQERFYPDDTVYRGGDNDRETVREIQEELNEQGYDCGSVDGSFGPNTEGALREWQEDHGFPPDGVGWREVIEELLGSDPEDDEDPDAPISGDPGDNDPTGTVIFTKYVESLPLNGEYYELGEGIHYRLCVTNATEHAIHDLEIWDMLKGGNEDGCVDRVPILDAGVTYNAYFTHAVTEEDVARGHVFNQATATWYAPAEDMWYGDASNETVVPTGSEPIELVRVEKSVLSTPQNGEYYEGGETVRYEIRFVNETANEVYDVEVYDFLHGNNEDACVIREPVVAPYGSASAVFEHVVTMEDVFAFEVNNQAEAYWTTAGSSNPLSGVSEIVSVPCGLSWIQIGEEPVFFGGPEVNKWVESTPANGLYYQPGEEVCYGVEVHNPGAQELLSVIVFDPLRKDTIWMTTSLSAGETMGYTFEYTVTPIDAAAGSLTNIATVTAEDALGNTYRNVSGSVVVPTGFGEQTEQSMTLLKEVISTPANGAYYTEGERINYRITYTNTGTVAVEKVIIYDPLFLTAFGEVGSSLRMEPGEAKYCLLDYVVTAEDVARGYVANVSNAAFAVDGVYSGAAISNRVVVDTDGDPNTTHTPGSGTIHWEELRKDLPEAEGELLCCYRELFSRDGGSMEYEVHLCDRHAATHGAILTMAQNAADANSIGMVWEYACGMWLKEVDAIYEEMYAAADNDARIILMSERTRMVALIANTQLAMKIAYPGHPAEVTQAVADFWREQLIELCYLTHTAPQSRLDSLLMVMRGAGEAAEGAQCRWLVSEERDDYFFCEDVFCADHAFPYEMTDILLAAEPGLKSWGAIRSLWEMELNVVYNELYEASGAEGGIAYLAEYAAFNSYIEAQEQLLLLMYPDDLEIVAEEVARSLMLRTQIACRRK